MPMNGGFVTRLPHILAASFAFASFAHGAECVGVIQGNWGPAGFKNNCKVPVVVSYCVNHSMLRGDVQGDVERTCANEGIRTTRQIKPGESVSVFRDIGLWPMEGEAKATAPITWGTCEGLKDGAVCRLSGATEKHLGPVRTAQLEQRLADPQGAARGDELARQHKVGKYYALRNQGGAQQAASSMPPAGSAVQTYGPFNIAWKDSSKNTATAAGGPCATEGTGMARATASNITFQRESDPKHSITFALHGGNIPSSYKEDGQFLPWTMASESEIRRYYKDSSQADTYIAAFSCMNANLSAYVQAFKAWFQERCRGDTCN